MNRLLQDKERVMKTYSVDFRTKSKEMRSLREFRKFHRVIGRENTRKDNDSSSVIDPDIVVGKMVMSPDV